MRPHTKLRGQVVHAKDKLLKEKASGVVYQIPCKNCNQVYIGETGRTLATRLQEHKDDVRKNAKNNSQGPPENIPRQNSTKVQ